MLQTVSGPRPGTWGPPLGRVGTMWPNGFNFYKKILQILLSRACVSPLQTVTTLFSTFFCLTLRGWTQRIKENMRTDSIKRIIKHWCKGPETTETLLGFKAPIFYIFPQFYVLIYFSQCVCLIGFKVEIVRSNNHYNDLFILTLDLYFTLFPKPKMWFHISSLMFLSGALVTTAQLAN